MLDPVAWLDGEASGAELVIPWHSHPGGCPIPSQEDALLFRSYPLIGISYGLGANFRLGFWQGYFTGLTAASNRIPGLRSIS